MNEEQLKAMNITPITTMVQFNDLSPEQKQALEIHRIVKTVPDDWDQELITQHLENIESAAFSRGILRGMERIDTEIAQLAINTIAEHLDPINNIPMPAIQEFINDIKTTIKEAK